MRVIVGKMCAGKELTDIQPRCVSERLVRLEHQHSWRLTATTKSSVSSLTVVCKITVCNPYLQGKSICSSSGSAGVGERGALWDAILGACSQELTSAHIILTQVSRARCTICALVREHEHMHIQIQKHTHRYCKRVTVL
jgi:hypothetical protein